ncbi:9879_t:CDS:10 [Dentiscutata heterogama]|uniref:9879_t:CDS:1 n=1 Tax=Dentiscutata heterogama TaxID=1316150 RepID=A0ACA9K9W9_9GLOM|nr:9879_t:CDS:10 [Dentiscutata heterogama]
MDDISSLSTSYIIKPKIIWRPLLPNIQCIQVPLTNVPSILDLYTFDVVSSGGGALNEGYEILPQDRTNKGRLREGDVKTITLVNEYANQLSNSTFAYTEYLGCSMRNGCRKGKCDWKGRIVVPQDKPLNLCNIEYRGSHDPEHVRKKPLRMANSVRKTITKRATNVTPSIMATELMDGAKILSTTIDTPKNQAQPTSTRFVPNLEAIQNALKYDKKLNYPSILEYEKVCTIMDTHEFKGTVISKQYGVKDAQDPKEQAVLLGIASTIMPTLLTKYPDFLALDSTGRRNSLNFPNTAFMVRSDEPRGRIVATFLIQYSIKNDVQLNPKWLAIDKWDPYLTATRKHFPNTQVVLCDWHEADALKEWFTKNLNDQWIRDRTFYQFRFVKRSRDQEEFDQWKITILDAKEFQSAIGITNLDIAETVTSYFRMHWFGDWVDTWPDYKRDGCPMKTNMLLESYFKKDTIIHYRGRYTKSLHSNLEKIGTSMRVDAGEVERFWNGEGKQPTKSKLQREKNKIHIKGELLYKKNLVQEIDQDTWIVSRFNMDVDIQYIAAESDDNDSDKDLFDEHNIKQQEKTLYITYRSGKFACPCSFKVIRGHDCQDIVAVRFFIGELKLQKPVAESVASSSLESYFRQKDDNGRNKNEFSLPQKRGPKNKRKNRLVPGEQVYLRDTILDKPYHKVQIVEIIGEGKVIVDITFESNNTNRHIVQQADIIGYADEQPNLFKKSKDSHGNIVVHTMPYGGKRGEIHLTSTCPIDTSLTIIQSAFTQQNIYSQAAAFAVANPTSRTHLLIKLKTGCINLFGSLSELFFEQFFHDSLDQNLLVVKSTVTTVCDSDYCPKKILSPTNIYDIVLIKPQLPVLPGEGNYFEICLKHWQEPCIIFCGSEFVSINGKKPKNVPVNAFKVDKYTSVESGKIKHLYLCAGKTTSTRQIDQRLPLVLVVNVAGINITDEGFYLESKDLPEEISFPEDVYKKQR